MIFFFFADVEPAPVKNFTLSIRQSLADGQVFFLLYLNK